MSLGGDLHAQHALLCQAEFSGALNRARQIDEWVEKIVELYETADPPLSQQPPVTFATTAPLLADFTSIGSHPAATTTSFQQFSISLLPNLKKHEVRFLARKAVEEFFEPDRETEPLFDYFAVIRSADGKVLKNILFVLDDGTAYEIPSAGVDYSHVPNDVGRIALHFLSHHIVFEQEDE
jgi:hypothetical protein